MLAVRVCRAPKQFTLHITDKRHVGVSPNERSVKFRKRARIAVRTFPQIVRLPPWCWHRYVNTNCHFICTVNVVQILAGRAKMCFSIWTWDLWNEMWLERRSISFFSQLFVYISFCHCQLIPHFIHSPPKLYILFFRRLFQLKMWFRFAVKWWRYTLYGDINCPPNQFSCRIARSVMHKS